MHYMVIERFHSGKVKDLYDRFEKRGRLLPKGLRYINSWIDKKVSICYQLMESESLQTLQKWTDQWNDLADFEVVPIINSNSAKEKVKAGLVAPGKMPGIEFDLDQAIDILKRTPLTLRSQLSGLPEQWIHHNEGDDSWSPFDIVGHFIHGERTDWMPRVQIILTADNKEFEPFDRFAQFENSKGKSIEELLDEFETLRNQNLKALSALPITPSNLHTPALHPELGKVNLKNLLAAWVVHDLGHIAQINRVMAKQYKSAIGIWTKYMPVVW